MKKVIIIIIIILTLIAIVFAYKNNSDNVVENNVKTSTGTYVNNEVSNESNSSNISTNESAEEKNTQINNIVEENNIVSNNSIYENVVVNNSNSTTSKSDIKESITPSGFMGSSLLKVALYSNGDVYMLHYDGEGYEDKNIASKDLIATNVTSIYSKGSGEDFEAIVIKGKSNMVIKNKDYVWITFEKE